MTTHERIRIRIILDVLISSIFGLEFSELNHALNQCDLPRRKIADTHRFRFRPLSPKGFWRIDKDLDPELRHTVLTLVASCDLDAKIRDAGGDREKGIESFLTQNHGEGWMLPETLRLADYGFGHDERSGHSQPVASRLGPRFYDWQLVQSAEEPWRECHLHARNLLGAHDYAHLLVEQIERRAANGEDYFGTLIDRFTRALLGNDGYRTVLFEIRSRNVADEDSFWTTVTALRDGGDLDENTHGQLLDNLHARGLLDDIGYRRRRGRNPPAPAAEPLLRVAEPRTDYRVATPAQDRQTDLFE